MNNTVETWLPIFPGFYGSHFEPNLSDEVYCYNQSRKGRVMGEIEYNDIDFDNKSYQEAVCQQCVIAIEGLLGGFVDKIEYQGVWSPKEYNFRNDNIDVVVHLSIDNVEKIKEYIASNAELWDKYLKKTYTSCDGFISHYSNKAEDWDLTTCLDHKHQCGAILDFICQSLGYNSYRLHEDVYSYVSEINYIKNNEVLENAHRCSYCDGFISTDSKTAHDIKEYMILCGTLPLTIKCSKCQ